MFGASYLGIWWRRSIWISENLKFDYLKNEKSFWSEIKNIFPCFTSVLFTKQTSKNVADTTFQSIATFKINMKFRSPNLYTIITLTKINKDFLKKEEKVKVFFIFMTMLSLRQVESNYGKKEPCERGCSRITKFSHCLNFRFR